MRKLGIAIIIVTLGGLLAYGFLRSDTPENADFPAKQQQINQSADSAPRGEANKTGADRAGKDEYAAGISEDDAKSIAVKASGVELSEVYNLWTERIDDGNMDFYDVDFIAGNKSYEYKIKADDGEVASMQYEIEKYALKNLQGNSISEDEARSIVINEIPGADKPDLHLKRDKIYGRNVYEVEAIYDGAEYEAVVDASTGIIIEWEMDRNIID